jgi:hypothetical protein
MANTAKTLFRGAATTNTGTTLYTVPALTTAVVTNVIVTNTSATDGTFTLALNGTALTSALTITGKGIFTLDLRQVLTATQTITGGANATSINFHIAGMEIV